MKIKTFIGLIVATLILNLIIVVSITQAISLPTPISGKIIGGDVAGLEIVVTNRDTGTFMTTKTTSVGEWLVDWSNSVDGGVRSNSQFIVQVKGCDDLRCKQIVSWNGGPSIHVEMNIPKVPCPKCGVCSVCEECKQETDWTKMGAGAIIGLLVGLIAFMGGGLKLYKNRAGGVTMQHRHRGVRGYHDCNVKHDNKEYSHRRWKDDPLGCIQDVKKIEEKGGLI